METNSFPQTFVVDGTVPRLDLGLGIEDTPDSYHGPVAPAVRLALTLLSLAC